jgi:uncharacterized protein (TIGR02757 family)
MMDNSTNNTNNIKEDKQTDENFAIIWQDNGFNWFAIINGEETFIGRGKNVPYPLEENDCWSLPNGKTFIFKDGKINLITPPTQEIRLKECLENLYEKFEESYLYSDPLGFVRKFDNIKDIEIAGFIAAGFAFGNVNQILNILNKIDSILNHKFYDFTVNFKISDGSKLFKGFYYRFIKENDLIALFLILSEIIKKYGSIENFFLEGYNPASLNLKDAIVSFSKRALNIADFSKGSRINFFFTSPEDNSPCKRINLYLRWMVRNCDNLDFGIWRNVNPSQLIIPVDTHIARICRYIGLTKRKNPSFQMAVEITENLKKLDHFDPTKYDFAISRLGILNLCTKNKNEENCTKCSIFGICNLP